MNFQADVWLICWTLGEYVQKFYWLIWLNQILVLVLTSVNVHQGFKVILKSIYYFALRNREIYGELQFILY